MTSTNSNSSLSKRRQTSHEPAPVTFFDEKSPSARLNRAIQSSNLHLVKRLLETHSSSAKNKKSHVYLDPRNQDPVTRKTSLILATETSNFEICKLLIQDYHVDSDSISRDLENNTVLHLAAAEGLDDIITLYHSHYPFVLDWANSEGMTALHIASQKGNESTVSLLLDCQADVELTDNEGNTSLHYAAAWGHLKIVLLLIDRGSPFWAKNNQTFTASDYAFSFAIQSALQESARAHFESKKQQRHQHVQREERKHNRNVVGSSSVACSTHGSDSSMNLTRPPATNRGVVKSPQQQHASVPRSNTPQLMANTLIPKISTSPITLMTNAPTSASNTSAHSHPLVPLAPSSSSSSISKPLASPTNSIATARTVSHLISKDLEAIQGFRTKTAPGNSSSNQSANHLQSQSISVQPLLSAASDPPQSNTNHLIPLQLLNGVGSKTATTTTTAIHELRSCNSTGNLAKQIQPNPSSNNLIEGSRNRAGSTESSDNPSLHSGLGFREGLSRLKYLKNSSSAFLLSASPNPLSSSSANNRPPASASSNSLPSPVSQNLPTVSSNVHAS